MRVEEVLPSLRAKDLEEDCAYNVHLTASEYVMKNRDYGTVYIEKIEKQRVYLFYIDGVGTREDCIQIGADSWLEKTLLDGNVDKLNYSLRYKI